VQVAVDAMAIDTARVPEHHAHGGKGRRRLTRPLWSKWAGLLSLSPGLSIAQKKPNEDEPTDYSSYVNAASKRVVSMPSPINVNLSLRRRQEEGPMTTTPTLTHIYNSIK